ncbi:MULTISPECIES: Htur_1727 family rSAM-partnered candidate RiPP [Haloferax]|uniref:RSAM-partnered protein n=1 Tax=Haloferax marinum TaxID=2666143 RepID=A0A6A8G4Y9_9EURY|nr:MULTISPECIES: Htur_1727 family rSAM-partnered candidate RiPP [Haloferax]KAB1196656.1 rSAM-partnered protein [Haloferax sp. CBA1150]MRW95662.1 rSAM-partnered protein [Haloferax marinum]
MPTQDDPRRKPRIDGSRQWEVFIRENDAEPMRHVGSVSAPSVDIATEQATTLFGFASSALWLCPADEVRRIGGNDLDTKGRGESTAADAEVTQG